MNAKECGMVARNRTRKGATVGKTSSGRLSRERSEPTERGGEGRQTRSGCEFPPSAPKEIWQGKSVEQTAQATAFESSGLPFRKVSVEAKSPTEPMIRNASGEALTSLINCPTIDMRYRASMLGKPTLTEQEVVNMWRDSRVAKGGGL